MKTKSIIFILFFSSVIYSQTFWGIDTDSPDKAMKWKLKNLGTEKYYYKNTINDFDIVIYYNNTFAFQRTAPGENMFDGCYNYLKDKLGEPTLIKDTAAKYSDTFNLSIGAQVFAGLKKFWRGWETETKYISLEWDSEMLQVICTAK